MSPDQIGAYDPFTTGFLTPDAGRDWGMSPETIDALAQSKAGRPALVMRGNKVLAAPPQSVAPGSIPGAAVLGTLAGDWAAMDSTKRNQLYQDQLESAERLRRMQELERFLAAGLVPPKQQGSADVPQSSKKQFLKSGDDIWEIDPFTGDSRLAVQGKPSSPRISQAYIPQDQWEKIKDLPEYAGMIAIPRGGGTVEVVQKRAEPKMSLAEMVLSGGLDQMFGAPSGIKTNSIPATSRFKIVERK